jgi:hypothetical protein
MKTKTAVTLTKQTKETVSGQHSAIIITTTTHGNNETETKTKKVNKGNLCCLFLSFFAKQNDLKRRLFSQPT